MKVKREKVKRFCGFLTKRENFPYESYEQWLSAALSIQMKQDLQKFSLHLKEIQRIAKFFSHLTFVFCDINVSTFCSFYWFLLVYYTYSSS